MRPNVFPQSHYLRMVKKAAESNGICCRQSFMSNDNVALVDYITSPFVYHQPALADDKLLNVMPWLHAVSYTHLTLPTNREV